MTQIYFVETVADDLKIGQMFVSWALRKDREYPDARRILDIKTQSDGKLKLWLDTLETIVLMPEQICVIREVA